MILPCRKECVRRNLNGQNSLSVQLQSRETRRIKFRNATRSFQKLSEVLPDQVDRMGLVLLGFSSDGENIIGYKDDTLLLWPIRYAHHIILTDLTETSNSVSLASKPWMRVPFPPLNFSLSNEEESQVELEVLQSRDASLLVLFCSTFNPCETDRGAAVTLIPTFGASLNRNAIINNSKVTILFPSIFMGADPDSRHLVEFGKNKHVLVLNCGDLLRFIHIESSNIPTVDCTENVVGSLNKYSSPLLDQTTPQASLTSKGVEERSKESSCCFPPKIQVLEPNSDWWCSTPTLDCITTPPCPTNMSPNDQCDTSVMRSEVCVTEETNFEIETFLGNLLAAQIRKLDGVMADYHMLIADPCFKGTMGNPHILVAVVVKICRRFNQATYAKRPKEDSRLACLIGVALAIDPCGGRVGVMKTVHLQPPSAKVSMVNSMQTESSKMLKRLTQKFAASLNVISTVTKLHPNSCSRREDKAVRLSNAAVLRSSPISVLINPVLPIGIKL